MQARWVALFTVNKRYGDVTTAITRHRLIPQNRNPLCTIARLTNQQNANNIGCAHSRHSVRQVRLLEV